MRISSLFSLVIYIVCGLAQSAGVSSSLSDIPRFDVVGTPILFDPLSIEQAFVTKQFKVFVDQGVPAIALRKALSFYLQTYGKAVLAKANDKTVAVTLKNDRYMGIADFTLPSTEKRFYLLNMQTGEVEKHYVSHGAKSGFKWAQIFSNELNSRKTSLGLYITGNTYQSTAFESRAMKIYGIEASNFNAYARNIVIHQAHYASPQFIEDLRAQYEKTGDKKFSPRLGRSFGCFAFDPAMAQDIIEKLKGGALVYAYVKGAERQLLQTPHAQEVIRVNPALDVGVDTEEEILQRVIKPKR